MSITTVVVKLRCDTCKARVRNGMGESVSAVLDQARRTGWEVSKDGAIAMSPDCAWRSRKQETRDA
jgi:ferredoxin